MFPTSNEDDGLRVLASSETNDGLFLHRLRVADDGRAELCQTQCAPGIGMHLQMWRGNVRELQLALVGAKPLPGGHRSMVSLRDIVGIIHNNDDHKTGHQPQSATYDGFLSLPKEFVTELQLVLDHL